MLPLRRTVLSKLRCLTTCQASVVEQRWADHHAASKAPHPGRFSSGTSEPLDTSAYLRSLFDLTGNVAFVSGGSRGIGRQTCLALARAGAHVMVTDYSEQERSKCDDLVHEIQDMGGKASSAVCDVRRQESVVDAMQQCKEELGLVGILCANAGTFGKTQKPEDLDDEEEWRNIFATNTDGVFYCCRAAFPHFREREKGKVVIMSSIASVMGHDRLPGFASSKGALLPLAKALASAWAKHNIQVNCVLPGIVETEAASPFLDDQSRKLDLERIPLARLAKPEDLVGAILYLASSASDYCTGTQLIVDGGLSSSTFSG